uniref:Uncharacterized protein n=1 Tax=Acrobeloides nanus TaxID=290746 RepID=A0A914DH18_9BILA
MKFLGAELRGEIQFFDSTSYFGKSPVELFKLFFTEELVQFLADESNRYATRRCKKYRVGLHDLCFEEYHTK